MKKIYLVIGVFLFLSSCKKQSATDNSKPASTTIATVTTHDLTDHFLVVDSFLRDDQHRIVRYIRSFTDSTSLPLKTYVNPVVFNYSGNDSLPNSYGLGVETRVLTYNTQGKLIKDSSESITYTCDYAYTGSNITYREQYPSNVGYNTDTLIITNGNIIQTAFWFYAPTYSKPELTSFTYSTIKNPFYMPNVGLILYTLYGAGTDYLSTNLVSGGVGPRGLSVSWTKDSRDRVIYGDETLYSGNTHCLINIQYE